MGNRYDKKLPKEVMMKNGKIFDFYKKRKSTPIRFLFLLCILLDFKVL
jgi:hypothetical protein